MGRAPVEALLGLKEASGNKNGSCSDLPFESTYAQRFDIPNQAHRRLQHFSAGKTHRRQAKSSYFSKATQREEYHSEFTSLQMTVFIACR